MSTCAIDNASRAWRIMHELFEKESAAFHRGRKMVTVRLTYDDIQAISAALGMVVDAAGGIGVVADAQRERFDRILGRREPLAERPLTGPGIYRPS